MDEVDLSGYGGQVGDPIVATALDDLDVVAVNVSLADSDGNAIEAGDATQTPAGSGRWTYAATAAVAVATGTTVRIEVTATDRAGGEGQVEQEKAV